LINADPKGQFSPLWITPREGHFTIDQDQWQRILTGALQESFYGRIVGKHLWLLCFAQSTSAAKVTKAWSTSTPQTPVLQHSDGSNTSIFFI
jgi:hypothetical protein